MTKFVLVLLLGWSSIGGVLLANISNTVSNDKDDIEQPTYNPAQGTMAAYVFKAIRQNNPENTTRLNYQAFSRAYLGYLNMQTQRMLPADMRTVTICDFSLSANEKRLWVIDLCSKKVLFHSLVSHGKNTGEEFATEFSNTEGSHQSSLGFYITSNTYQGSNGYSLRLEGVDAGMNDKAMSRAIVMHGAWYCSEDFIKEHGRLGRSYGCPSVPIDLHQDIINVIKDQTLLYIYHQDFTELNQSVWLHTPNKTQIAAIERQLI